MPQLLTYIFRSDQRRQLGYFQNDVTRNSADHQVRDKTNTTQDTLWTKHKMFHSNFILLRRVPKCQMVAAGQKKEICFYIKPSVCIYNIHTYKNTCPWGSNWSMAENAALPLNLPQINQTLFLMVSWNYLSLHTHYFRFPLLLCNFWMSNCAFWSFPVISWLSSHGWFLSEVNWCSATEYFPYWDSLPLSGFPSFDVLLYHGTGEPSIKSRTLISSSAKRNKYKLKGYILLAKKHF